MTQDELEKSQKIARLCTKLMEIERVAGTKGSFDEEQNPFLCYVVGEIHRVRNGLEELCKLGIYKFISEKPATSKNGPEANSETAQCDQGVVVTSERFFVRVLPERDKMVFSHHAGGQYLHIYLTKETAKKHGIQKGMKSYTFGDEVRLNDRAPCRAATWKNGSGLLRYYSQRGFYDGLVQMWEMFEVKFTDDNRIVRGRKIAMHEDAFISNKEK